MPRNEKGQLAPANTHRAPAPEDMEDLPPAYSMPSPSASSSMIERPGNISRMIPGLPNVNFSAYVPSGAVPSNGLNTITITDTALCRSPKVLAKLISEQLALPPAPELRIRGTHKGWGGRDEEDFDLRLNMNRYFMPREGEPGLSYSKLVSAGRGKKAPLPNSGASAIEQWAQAFCSDSAQDKCFQITRKLSNWDSDYLVGCIHALLQTLNYKGTINVTFPVNYQKVVIRPNQTFGAALRSVFMGVETYECEVYWPYASDEPIADADSIHRSQRKCLVRSEMGWFKDWKPVLRAALLSQRKGWVGLDDWMEVAMRPREPETTPKPWGEPR